MVCLVVTVTTRHNFAFGAATHPHIFCLVHRLIKSNLTHKQVKLVQQIPNSEQLPTVAAPHKKQIKNNCTKMNLSLSPFATLLLLLDAAPTLVSATK